MFNQAIMDLISNDRYEAHHVYQEMRKKWPQINEQTRIEFVRSGSMEIHLQETSRAADWLRDMIAVPVMGWMRLKAQLFPTKYVVEKLDDPDERWRYTVRLWKAVIHAPKYQFWRTLGKWFKRPDWIRRGMEMQPNPVMPKTEIVKLERYRWQLNIHAFDHYGELICAYHPGRDTFYVRQGRR